MWKWQEKHRADPGSNQYIPWKWSQRTPRYYTPFTAQTPWLFAILVAVLACVAVLETAFREGTRGGDGKSEEDKRWIRRQANNSSASTAETSSTASTAYESITTSPTTSSKSTADGWSSSTKSDSYVSITTDASTEAPSYLTLSGYITISTTPTRGSPSVASAAQTGPSGYISIMTTSSTDEVSLSTASSDYVTIKTTSSNSVDTTGIVYSAEQPAYVTITTAYTSNGQTHTTVSVAGTGTPVPPSAAQSSYNTISTTDTSSAEPTTSFSIFDVTTTLNDGSVTTQKTSTPVATTTGDAKAPGTVKESQIQIGTTFTQADYFNSSYLAVVVAVILKMIWAMVFASFKMMEPFYQLSRPDGASAKHGLLAEYLATGYSIAHIQHIFSGHWIIFLTTVVYICIGVLAPLATESMTVISTAFCTTPDGGQANCNPVWVLNNDVARALQSILSLIAVMVLLLIILNWPRKSGIFSDPSSVATMASLLSHEETLHDFRQLDQSVDKKQLEVALSGNRYTLSSYELSAGSGMYRYGLVKTSASSTSSPYSLSQTRNFDLQSRPEYSSLPNPSNMTLGAGPVTGSTQPFSFSSRLIRDSFFLASVIALFGVVLAYYLDGSNSGFNRWFNSNTFGPRFILTTAAVIIDFHWKTLEREVRILVPYLRLGQRMAKPELSILVNISGTPVDNLPSALWRGEWFHALTAVTAILSDVLIVAVAGVPYSSAQIWDAFLASAYLSLAILAWMILATVGIFVWRKKVAKLKLPKEPDTLLSMWMMLADEGNPVRKEFDGWEMTKSLERDRACKGRGGSYWGGWSKDETEQWRWSIGLDGGGRVGVI